MAEKLLQTRIQLKYDTLANWEASSLVLKAGEAAVATYTYMVGESEINAVKVKYGDGKNTFANLPEVTAVSKDLSDAIAALRSEYEAYIAEHAEEVAADKAAQAEKDAAQDAAIIAEKERAEAAEANLQNQINTIIDNPDAEGVINSIKEFTQYITEHGEVAEGFRTDIDKNKEDIAALEKKQDDYQDANDAAVAAVDKKVDDLDASLATIAKTGNVNDLIQTEGDVLVFNCGSSTVNIN